jgi:acetyltransferase-like isoleucine patch superfamily enzyme
MVNDNSKPLILVGSRHALGVIKRICQQHDISITGIVDSDYFGNTSDLEGVPVIDTEINLEKYKQTHNFFLASVWTPQQDPVNIRNKNRRDYLIGLVDTLDLPCITLIDKTSIVDPTVTFGKNCLVDCLTVIGEHNVFGNYVSIYHQAGFGHHNHVGNNCVFQRKSGITSDTIIENNCYFGLNSNLLGCEVIIRQGTVVHPGLNLHRSTQENEVVSLAGKDLRRVYFSTQEG